MYESQVLLNAESGYQSYRIEKETQTNKYDVKKTKIYHHICHLLKL